MFNSSPPRTVSASDLVVNVSAAFHYFVLAHARESRGLSSILTPDRKRPVLRQRPEVTCFTSTAQVLLFIRANIKCNKRIPVMQCERNSQDNYSAAAAAVSQTDVTRRKSGISCAFPTQRDSWFSVFICLTRNSGPKSAEDDNYIEPI